MLIGYDQSLTGYPLLDIVHMSREIWLLGEVKNKVLLLGKVKKPNLEL